MISVNGKVMITKFKLIIDKATNLKGQFFLKKIPLKEWEGNHEERYGSNFEKWQE